PKLANKTVREHWRIENSLHYVLDVTFKEDDSRIRLKNATENMAILRRLALNLIKISDKKGSVKSILKQCAWNDEVRDLIIMG
ncbi:ISPg6 transposase, partial [Psychrobacter sp. 1501(2011)]